MSRQSDTLNVFEALEVICNPQSDQGNEASFGAKLVIFPPDDDSDTDEDEGSDQRWSPRGRPWPRGRPRGHILKSLALASKVKSLASSPRKLACPRLENSTIFWNVKILWSA